MHRAALVFAFLLSCMVGAEIASARDRHVTIEWPDPAFRDLQAAMDAAPEGATVEIGPGVHLIDRPIYGCEGPKYSFPALVTWLPKTMASS